MEIIHTAPCITVVIPCYNAEQYIEACVNSLQLERYPEVNAILVDDGSTDRTAYLCDCLAASRPRLLVSHRDNCGAAAARNAGLRLADGNWVWFVDSDDLVSPSAFEVLLPVCRRSQADAIQFKSVCFNDACEVSWPSVKEVGCASMDSLEFAAELHSGVRQHYAWSFLFRKNGQVQPYFYEEYSLFEDAVSIEKYAEEARAIEVLDVAIYGYRQVDSSVSHLRSDSSADSGLRAVRAISNMPVRQGDEISRKCMELSLLFTAYRVANRRSSIKLTIKKEIEKRVKAVGIMGLGRSRLLRYLLLECGAMDLIIDWREHVQ